MSSIDPSIPPLRPHYPPPPPNSSRNEPPALQNLISQLQLQPHIEGGYFVETDRDATRVANPFLPSRCPSRSAAAGTGTLPTTITSSSGSVSTDPGNKLNAVDKAKEEEAVEADAETQADNNTRNASTSIHYLLTPSSPLGCFHRNKGRTIHTLHRGRGRYVLIHADEVMGNEEGGYDADPIAAAAQGRRARVETFVVGQDIAKGERLQWVVEGGKYKASFLLPSAAAEHGIGGDGGERGQEEGLLISETVVPGFEFRDHDFLRRERFRLLVGQEQERELEWLVRRDG